nr:hypothetical protein [Tanacetum cinerariifolium]
MLMCKQAEKGVPLQAEQADWLADTDEEIDEQELEAHYNYMEKTQEEKMLMCKQAEKGVPLQAEQADWLADTDEEIDEQELEAHYNYMEKTQEKILKTRTLYSLKAMDLEFAQNNVVTKLHLLKQVLKIIANEDGTSTSTISGLVTTKEKVQKKNDVKARSMLLMALPNEHLLTFSQYKDAKTLFEAIQARFSESLDSIFNRLQKIVSQLAILGENISQEYLNMKFLRSLPAKWNTHVVVWRNKPDLETMSFEDLYNNFKIVEQEFKRMITSSASSESLNMAFLSSPGNLEQIPEDDLEEMDLKWQLALLSIRARREFRSTRSQESRLRNQDSSRKIVIVEDTSSKAMVAINEAGFDWSYMADEEVSTNMAFMAFSNSE